MRSGWVSQGKVTEQFERELAKYSDARESVVVNNGTSALLCAILAHGVKLGDRVLVSDYTHVATANVPKLLGCKVSFVDIDANTFNIDNCLLEDIARKFRPRFVIAVDVAGMPNDIEALLELSKKYRFTLIEDAAESMGGEINNRRVGSLGCTSVVSFHAAKQLTTVEGGAVLTQDSRIARRCRLIRNHGGAGQKYVSKMVGMNLRTTDIQSALGLVQLEKLEGYVSQRNRIAREYRAKLSQSFRFQEVPRYVTRHPYMMFIAVARSRRVRGNLRRHLERHGIETRIPWPPLHQQPHFKASDKEFQRSKALYETSISLPLYNSMEDHDVQKVISAVVSFTQGS
jgi:dTDP-4-amino-4,6-dideoxygalactose transaminase